jgi:hypothetical protein
MEHYAPVELLLPDSGEAVLAILRERLALDVGRARSADRILLDSFDGRLRAAGLRAEAPVRGATLALYEPGAPARREKVARAPRYLVQELPRGPLRERLAGVLEERALLPAVRVRGTVRPLAVLNRDAKTVVRLELEDAEAVLERGRRVPARLAPHRRAGARLRRRARAHAARAARPARLRARRAPAVRRGGARGRRAAGGHLDQAQDRARARHPHRPGRRPRAAAACWRSPRRTCRARSTTSTPSSCTTCASPSAARARCLRELKDVHDPERRTRLRDELKWAQNLTGPVRDLDVELLEWEELVGLLAPERQPELEPLRKLLAQRRGAS